MSDIIAHTRTAAFEARLKKRYSAERRFKFAGLFAVLFSVSVLAFLLVAMAMDGIGGFQRAELRVPVDFSSASLSVNTAEGNSATVVRALETQGLPQIVAYSAEQALGAEAAEQLNSEAWRTVAEAVAADPDKASGVQNFWLPASEDLATALSGDSVEIRTRIPSGSFPARFAITTAIRSCVNDAGKRSPIRIQ